MSIQSSLKSLPIDTKGHALHLQKGTEHTETTLWVELLDNSDKAIQNRLNKDNEFVSRIDIFYNNCFRAIKDNGIGMNLSTLKRLLTNYQISVDEINGMSKSGIGFNTVAENFLTDNNICIIISKYVEDGDSLEDAIPGIELLVKTDEGVKQCLSEKLPKSLQPSRLSTKNWINSLIPETGTLFIFSSKLNEIDLENDYKDCIEKLHLEDNFKNGISSLDIGNVEEAIKKLFSTKTYDIFINNKKVKLQKCMKLIFI